MYVVCGGDEMRPAKITLFPPSTFSDPPSENCLCFEYLMINKNIVKTSVNVVAERWIDRLVFIYASALGRDVSFSHYYA